MQSSQVVTDEIPENLNEDVNSTLGFGDVSNQEAKNDAEELPAAAKKRLGMQEKRHKKEMRQMKQQMDEMHERLNASNPQMKSDGYTGYGKADAHDEMHNQIKQAISETLRQRDEQERKARDADKLRYVQQQHQELSKKLDDASSKYDDFDDVVYDDTAPYTQTMKDISVLLPNPEDVLYKLGKDKTNLKRIADLHPVDQSRELIKLSMALMMGKDGKDQSVTPKTLGNIKNSPVNSRGVNEVTPVSEIRRRMREKDGWK